MNQTYWVVWEPKSGYTKCKHYDFKTAQLEAERLATLNPSKEFVVLMAVGGAVSRSVDKLSFTNLVPPF